MYIIGINFGYYETTASYIDTNDTCQIIKRLHILDGNSDESNKVESAVCCDQITGEWRFTKDESDYSSPTFYQYFKTPTNTITLKEKEAFTAFIKLVYEHILSNNEFLTKDSFCIYAAYPSVWDKGTGNQIKEYKNFLSEIIPINSIIKKTYAAYYKFNHERAAPNATYLLIDVNACTIDFASYNKHGVECFTEGFCHGASRVERKICKYFKENDSDFIKAKEEIKNLNGMRNNWHDIVLNDVKQQKDNYYERKLSCLILDVSNRAINYSFKKRVFDAVRINQQLLEDTILKNHKLILKKDIEYVKSKTGCPNYVILTGSKSRMPWLQKSVTEVFRDSEIYQDPEPSYIVADGLVYYGMKSVECKPNIEIEINGILNKYNDVTIVQEVWAQIYNNLRKYHLNY